MFPTREILVLRTFRFCLFLPLETLEHIKIHSDIYFLFTLLVGNIDCPGIVARLSFTAPTRKTRSKIVFRLSPQVTDYANNIFCNQMMKSQN